MNKQLLKHIEWQLGRFEKLLLDRGYFYDVNQLHNYFSYNNTYSPLVVRKYWQKFIESSRQPGICVDAYIHIPFCCSKCAYCLFPSWEGQKRKNISRYVDYLIDNIEYFSLTFNGVQLRNLYIGGGTPSILHVSQMRKVMENLFKYFSFQENGQRTVECNPHSAQDSKFFLLKEHGFNRLSFGVQSLNRRALKLNKRNYQDYREIKKAILEAKKAGFKDINIDLIAGLAGDSLAGFERSFSRMAELKPGNIVVYGLMPPDDYYLNDILKMDRIFYFRRRYPKIIAGAVKLMEKLGKRYGYIPDSLDQARFHWGFRRKDCVDLPAEGTYSGEYADCTLGLGTFSRSHIKGVLEYRQSRQSARFAPDTAIFDGRVITKKQEILKFIINNLDRDSRIALKAFRDIFKVDFLKTFPYAVAMLKKTGRVKVTGNWLVFRFEKPEDKYISTLFFFEKQQ